MSLYLCKEQNRSPHLQVNPVSPSFFLQVKHLLFLGFLAGIGSSLSSSVLTVMEVGTGGIISSLLALGFSCFDSASTLTTSTLLSDNVGFSWRSDWEVELVLVLASLVWGLVDEELSFFCVSL